MRYYTLTLLILAALLLPSCKNDDDTKPTKPEEQDLFDEIFDDLSEDHTWNMSLYSWVRVTADYTPKTIGVYCHYYNRYYILAESENCAEDMIVSFDIPNDLDRVLVAVDGVVNEVSIEGTVEVSKATTDGVSLPTWASDATPLPWIVAAELGDDYDFNDFVAQVTRNTDGSLTITPLANGLSSKLWLHYTNGTKDIVVTPRNLGAPYIEQELIDENNQNKYAWHKWFGSEDREIASGYAINTFGGANGWQSMPVTLPQTVFGDDWVTLTDWCLSEIVSIGGYNDYAKPLKGFYLTVKKPTIYQVEEEETMYKHLLTMWPAGERPYMMVIPDVSCDDTADKHVGWRWPSEGSRIDMVYPKFIEWVMNPLCVWHTTKPLGWNDRPAQNDDDGHILYFGYYPRQ